MENLLEPLYQDGYQDVIYVVSSYKKLRPKHIILLKRELVDLL